MTCIACSLPAEANHFFCTECGWPLRQPSPYTGQGKELPVTTFAASPARDSVGRPLAYASNPKSGRAYVPGEGHGAIDKIPDYPSVEGTGSRRTGEVRAGLSTGSRQAVGTHADCRLPLGIGLGAGRVVWVDDLDIYTWDQQSAAPAQKSLGGLRPTVEQPLLTSGWLTYLRTTEGLAVHDGRANEIRMLSPNGISAIGRWKNGVVAASGDVATCIPRDGVAPGSAKLPFTAVALASDAGVVAAFSQEGAVAVLDDSGECLKWDLVLNSTPGSSFQQGWVVNGRAGVRLNYMGDDWVHYAAASPGTTPPERVRVESDSPVSVIPGRSDWREHRILGYVGGSRPRITVVSPTDDRVASEVELAANPGGQHVAVVRRAKDETGAILVAYIDEAGRLAFVRIRSNPQIPLPDVLPLTHGSYRHFLIPSIEHVIVLAYNGDMAVLNSVSLP